MPYNRVALTIIALVTVSACVQDQQSASAIAPQPTSCTGGTPCDERLAANLDGLMPVTPSTGITTTTGFASWKVCKAWYSIANYHGAVWIEPKGDKAHLWFNDTQLGMENYLQPVRDGYYRDQGELPWSLEDGAVHITTKSGTHAKLVMSAAGSFKFSFTNPTGGVNYGDGQCFR